MNIAQKNCGSIDYVSHLCWWQTFQSKHLCISAFEVQQWWIWLFRPASCQPFQPFAPASILSAATLKEICNLNQGTFTLQTKAHCNAQLRNIHPHGRHVSGKEDTTRTAQEESWKFYIFLHQTEKILSLPTGRRVFNLTQCGISPSLYLSSWQVHCQWSSKLALRSPLASFWPSDLCTIDTEIAMAT